jgi:hypothetical protein
MAYSYQHSLLIKLVDNSLKTVDNYPFLWINWKIFSINYPHLLEL